MPVKKGKEGVKQEMHKFKEGELHSGSKSGPTVKNRKQAIAIALNQAGMSNKKNESLKWLKNEIKCILAESIISGKSYTQDFDDEDNEPDTGMEKGRMDMTPRDVQKYQRRKAMMDKIIRKKIASGERSPDGAEHYKQNIITQAMGKGKVPSEKFAKVRIDKDGSIVKTRSSGRRGEAGRTPGTNPGPLGHSRYNTMERPSKNPGELKPASDFVGKAPSDTKAIALSKGADAAGQLHDKQGLKRRMLANKLARMRGHGGMIAKANINPEVKKSIFKKRAGQKPLPKPELP